MSPLAGEVPWSDTAGPKVATLLARFKTDRTVMWTVPVWAIEVGKVLRRLRATEKGAKAILDWVAPGPKWKNDPTCAERAGALLGVYELLEKDLTPDQKLLRLWEYIREVSVRSVGPGCQIVDLTAAGLRK